MISFVKQGMIDNERRRVVDLENRLKNQKASQAVMLRAYERQRDNLLTQQTAIATTEIELDTAKKTLNSLTEELREAAQ